ncbi:MAG: choice-of-anchor J domain-containing protein [Muribaculaceae bacterium]|nr:choice-of-anchor J domain-containing protein [Muribaculaceae bacterium]
MLPGNLCGYLIYSSDKTHVYDMVGWNTLNPTTGVMKNLWTDNFCMSGSPLQTVFVRDGRLCGYNIFWFFGEIYGISYVELDLATGETLVNEDFSDTDKLFLSVAYVPASDEIYGFIIDFVEGGYKFAKTSASAPLEDISVLKHFDDNDYCQSFTYNEYEDMFYGINRSGDMVEIDRRGNIRTIMDKPFGEIEPYMSGLAYSPLRQGYYYNLVKEDGSSLYELKPVESVATKLCDFPTNEEFAALFCGEVEPLTLERPEVQDIAFERASTSGDIIWKIPSVTVSGATVTSPVAYTVLVDGSVVTTGTVIPGNTVTARFDNLNSGYHTFSIFTEKDGIRGKRHNITKYLGYDTPKSPEKVTLTDTEVSWTPVESGLYDSFLELDKLQYQVWVDGKLIATTQDTAVPSGIDLSLPVSRHTAYVIAECNGIQSQAAHAKSIVCGVPYSLPANWRPSLDQSSDFEIIDANRDTYTWFYDEESESFLYAWDHSNEPWNRETELQDGNDWLILPPFICDDAEGLYRFSFDARSYSEWYAESFEIWTGNGYEVKYFTDKIFESGPLTHTEDKRYEALFTVSEPTEKYLAVRVTSDADNCEAFGARNFKVEKVGSVNGPGAIDNIVAIPADKGEKSVTVSFTLPKMSYNGQPISANEVLTAVVTGKTTAAVSGKPGETVSAEVSTTGGYEIINVNCRNSAGLFGEPVSVTVFTGYDTPTAPEEIKIRADEDNLTLHFTWETPKVGIHGGYVDASNITYYIDEGSWFELKTATKMGTGVNEYTLTLAPGSRLESRWFSLASVDAEGNYEDYATAMVLCGVPYQLPMQEFFKGGEAQYSPSGTIEDPASYHWGIGEYSVEPLKDIIANENGFGFARQSDELDPVWLALPRFTTNNVDNPALILTARVGEGYSNVEVYGLTSGISERVKLGEIKGDGWMEEIFILPKEFKNRGWVEIDIQGIPVNEYDQTLIGSFEVRDYAEKDLRLRWADVPLRQSIGQQSTAYVKLQNVGSKTISHPEFTLTMSNRNYECNAIIEEVPSEIKPGEICVVKCALTPSADGRGKLKVLLDAGDDDNPIDNTIYEETNVVTGRSNVVTDLKARPVEGGVQLTWTAPLSNDKIGFEEEVFAQLSDELSVFRNLDRDQAVAESFYAAPYYLPVVFSNRASGWVVWNEVEMNEFCTVNWTDPVFAAGEGMNSVVAFCPKDGVEADDWLISPRVQGNSELSFMAAPASIEAGPETIEIMVSSTDDNPESFKKYDTVIVKGDNWGEYKVMLPSDACYFALRYASKDKFGVFVDNIRFSPDLSQIDHYEIWRDGQLVGISDIPEYLDAAENVNDGNHIYNVVPVMKSEERGILSNSVTILKSGVEDLRSSANIIAGRGNIRITGLSGKRVDIFNTEGIMIVGKILSSDDELIPLASGLYVVNVAGTTRKLIVK